MTKAALSDDLAWLRRRDDPRVMEFLRRENQRTEREMRGLRAFESALYAEIRSRIQETDRSVPAPWDGYGYFHRTEEGRPYRIWARTRPDGSEEVYLDENALAEPHGFFRVGGHAVSPDHAFVAYAYDTTGDEDHQLAIREIATGETLPVAIRRTTDDLAWAADSRSLFYVRRDARKRAHRVYRHRLGFDPSEDALVYEEPDEAFHLELRADRRRRFLFIESSSRTTTQAFLIDARETGRPPRALAPRRPGVEVRACDAGDALLVRTNLDAIDFRLLRAPLRGAEVEGGPSEWEEVVPHRGGIVLEAVEAFADFWVLLEREGAVRHLRVLPERVWPGYRPRLDAPVRALESDVNLEFEADVYRYVISALDLPPVTCEIDPASGERRVLKRQPAPGFDPDRVRSERIWVTAGDGVEIPISLLAPADLELDGDNPCLLTGYGSYGISVEPAFTTHALSLVERGFVYAIAHVRGGGELGEAWHREGKMLAKRNSFTDFIRCAETLIERGYTRPARLGVQGRSAGGLLAGAVVNMRPDLFGAAIAGVPFVDVLATMLDPDIPLTVIEYDEWGDPREPRYYDYIRSYSPFDNVREGAYPHMLVTAGLNDPRVQYWEPARWVARLRERRTDDRMLLLKTDMGAGHLGPSDRFAWLADKAFEYAFLVRALAPELIPESIPE